ncbi:MAG: hypothetical protein JO022_18205 [Acidobacteriaceae bacterium]|nr:hypothetical protein [Acidobacteriaceae bacterium]
MERSDRLMAGVFPPVANEESACPKLPQAFDAAPGGEFGGHHSYPGGLAVHECFNLRSSLNLMGLYQKQYDPNLLLDRDLLVAAPIWHDWAKTLVFQWNVDGTEFAEFTMAGTGAHHVLGLAETMKRKLPVDEVLTQASAHAAPVLGNEPRVVNWIRAAGIIAGVDPFAEGYLRKDENGQMHLAHYRPEFSIHNLSDADFVVSIPAMAAAESLLKQLAPEFGFSPDDRARYNTSYRNPVLSRVPAERLQMTRSAREEVRRVVPR